LQKYVVTKTDKLDVRPDRRSIDIEHLDITSYLSTPNHINACKEYVGTVYSIFLDLCVMGWLGNHTALYTIQAHVMDNTVQVFDPETVQVRKDERCNIKIKVVVDWSNGAGYRRGKEYRSFFKRNNQFNKKTQTLTYLLTPWSRAPLEKLPGSAASQEVPRIFGTRKFITVPTSARHPSLS
jgi:hypothetical protein